MADSCPTISIFNRALTAAKHSRSVVLRSRNEAAIATDDLYSDPNHMKFAKPIDDESEFVTFGQGLRHIFAF